MVVDVPPCMGGTLPVVLCVQIREVANVLEVSLSKHSELDPTSFSTVEKGEERFPSD